MGQFPIRDDKVHSVRTERDTRSGNITVFRRAFSHTDHSSGEDRCFSLTQAEADQLAHLLLGMPPSWRFGDRRHLPVHTSRGVLQPLSDMAQTAEGARAILGDAEADRIEAMARQTLSASKGAGQ